jgi:hypothetical protein
VSSISDSDLKGFGEFVPVVFLEFWFLDLVSLHPSLGLVSLIVVSRCVFGFPASSFLPTVDSIHLFISVLPTLLVGICLPASFDSFPSVFRFCSHQGHARLDLLF